MRRWVRVALAELAAGVGLAGLLVGPAGGAVAPTSSVPECPPGVQRLPGLGTGGSSAIAFNDRFVVGSARRTSDGPREAVVWRRHGGAPRALPRSGLVSTTAVDIDRHDRVVGVGEDRAGRQRAWHWAPGQGTRRLAGLGGDVTYARRINDQGAIAGAATRADGAVYAVRWRTPRSRPEVLRPVRGDQESFAKGINNAGVVGGDTDRVTASGFLPRAALWDRRGRPHVLRGIGGPGTAGELFEVNDAGEAAGTSATSRDVDSPYFVVHAAFWYADGTPRDLGALPRDNFSGVLGLSPAGYAAGFSVAADYATGEEGTQHAFVWPGHGRVLALPAPEGDWATTASLAHQIDDRGTVAGHYQVPGGADRAVLWTCAFDQALQPSPGAAAQHLGSPGDGAAPTRLGVSTLRARHAP